MKLTKVFKTEDNEILIVTLSTDGFAGRKYVSVTANSISPISLEDAKEQVRENLEEGELWRMAVEGRHTELGLTEWVEYVLDQDKLDGLDNSLYSDHNTIDGTEYIYSSNSCGCLHDDIKAVTPIFNEFIELHLADRKHDITHVESFIKSQKSDNVDKKVIAYTNQILSVINDL